MLDLSITGVRLAGPSTLWQLTGSSLDAENHVGQPAQVAVKEIAIGDVPQSVSVAPISVSIYRFPVAGAAQ
jgi:alpha-N-arabinofuranosidase